MATKIKASATKASAANATPPAGASPAVKRKPTNAKPGKGVDYSAAHSLRAAEFARGAGGEVHQVTAAGQPVLTTTKASRPGRGA